MVLLLLLCIAAFLLLLILIILTKTLLIPSHRKKRKLLLENHGEGEKSPGENIHRTEVRNLQEAIRHATVSFAETEKIDFSLYSNFIEFLKSTFPLVHATLQRDLINGYALLYTWVGRQPSLTPVALMAHYDVVPADFEDGWSCDPFEGVMKENCLYGRGTLDDKHCLMGTLEAVERLLSQNFQPERTVYLCFGHDEEIGGKQGAGSIAACLEKRGICLEWVLDEGSMIYADSIMPGIEGPAALIGITEKGHVDVRLRACESPGHAATPPASTTVGQIAKAITKIESCPFPTKLTPTIRQFLKTLSPYAPFPLKLLLNNVWIFSSLLCAVFASRTHTNAMVRTTQAATRFSGSSKENILPATATASVNIRLLHGVTIKQVIDRFRKIIGNEEITIEPMEEIDYCDPLPVSSIDNTGYLLLSNLISETMPQALTAPFLVLGATDSRHFKNISENIYRFIPIPLTARQINLLHGVDEHINIDDYLGMIDFYTNLLRKI